MSDWRMDAACRLADAALFDLAEGEERRHFGAITRAHAEALDVCAACPVREQCLAEAKAHCDSGVRGGRILENGRDIGRRYAARPATSAHWAELLIAEDPPFVVNTPVCVDKPGDRKVSA